MVAPKPPRLGSQTFAVYALSGEATDIVCAPTAGSIARVSRLKFIASQATPIPAMNADRIAATDFKLVDLI